MDDNPYAPPVCNSRAVYDNTLMRRIIVVVAKLCLFVLAVDALALARYASIANLDRPVVAIVWGFFYDWKNGAMPTIPESSERVEQ